MKERPQHYTAHNESHTQPRRNIRQKIIKWRIFTQRKERGERTDGKRERRREKRKKKITMII